MKVQTLLLLENPRDQVAISSLARAILSAFLRKLEAEVSSTGYAPRYIELTMKDLNKGEGTHLYIRMKHTPIVFHNRNGDGNGYYDGWAKHISVDCSFDRALQGDRAVLTTAQNVLVHELRHRLDDSLSKGKSFNNRDEYLNRQEEINARFSEAIHIASEQLLQSLNGGEGMSLAHFMEVVDSAFIEKQLTSVFRGSTEDRQQRNLDADHFFKNGIFGRRMSSQDIAKLLRSMADSNFSTAVDDPRLRRLIKRAVKQYYYIVERHKQKKGR